MKSVHDWQYLNLGAAFRPIHILLHWIISSTTTRSLALMGVRDPKVTPRTGAFCWVHFWLVVVADGAIASKS